MMDLDTSAKELQQKLAALMLGRQLNRHLFRMCRQLVREHRVQARAHGVTFPDMTVLPVRTAQRQAVLAVREDLDDRAVQVYAVNLTVIYPEITAEQIAFALQHAWPGRNFSNLNLSQRRTAA